MYHAGVHRPPTICRDIAAGRRPSTGTSKGGVALIYSEGAHNLQTMEVCSFVCVSVCACVCANALVVSLLLDLLTCMRAHTG
jgi:hypothetical protein